VNLYEVTDGKDTFWVCAKEPDTAEVVVRDHLEDRWGVCGFLDVTEDLHPSGRWALHKQMLPKILASTEEML
jgi:hypothetical protein